MADDVATPLNPLVALVEKEKFEDALLDKTPLDINGFQWSHEKEPSRRVVRTQVNRKLGIVDCLLTHMPNQFIWSLFLLVEPRHKGLKSVNVKTTMFVLIVELGFLMMAIIAGYRAEYLVRTICCILDFLQL
jgi:hypothetical protein